MKPIDFISYIGEFKKLSIKYIFVYLEDFKSERISVNSAYCRIDIIKILEE